MTRSIDQTPDDNWWNTFLKTYQPSPQTMLDLGCGHGRHVRWFAAHGFEATGIEVLPDRVAEARKQTGSNLNATFVQDDLVNLAKLNLTPHSFGVIFDRNSSQFMHLEHQAAHFTAVANLLAPDGVFAYSIVEATGPEAPPFIRKLEVSPADSLPIIEKLFTVIKKNVRPSRNLPNTTATEIIARKS